MRAYRTLLTPDDGGTFLVTCPALPEVTTFGDSLEACAHNARDAIEEALAARIAAAAATPIERYDGVASRNDVQWVRLPTLTDLKVSLYAALRKSGLTRAELARRLGWNRNSVDRLFQLDHASRLDQIDAAAEALGLVVRAELAPPPAREAA